MRRRCLCLNQCRRARFLRKHTLSSCDGGEIENNVLTIELGDGAYTLSAQVETFGGASGEVTYSVSNASVANVSEDGVITAISAGECSVRAVCVADAKVYGEVLVRVVDDNEIIDTAPHLIKMEGGYANLESAVYGSTVLLTPVEIEGWEFVCWQFSCEVQSSGNMFIMPAQDVEITALYKKISVNMGGENE